MEYSDLITIKKIKCFNKFIAFGLDDKVIIQDLQQIKVVPAKEKFNLNYYFYSYRD